jgi:hypothetical protein
MVTMLCYDLIDTGSSDLDNLIAFLVISYAIDTASLVQLGPSRLVIDIPFENPGITIYHWGLGIGPTLCAANAVLSSPLTLSAEQSSFGIYLSISFIRGGVPPIQKGSMVQFLRLKSMIKENAK